ncbi:MAG TPA: FkbM family methyltransferase [Roseomonas sp.]
MWYNKIYQFGSLEVSHNREAQMADRDDSPQSRKEKIGELVVAARRLGLTLVENKFSEKFLRSLRLEVKTLLDVGVHQGTPELYKAFNKSRIVSFDPSPVSLEIIRKRYPQLEPDFNLVALGDEPGMVQLNLMEGGSTIMDTVNPAEKSPRFAGKIDVPVVTLDSVIAEKQYEAPFGIKIDAEGYEIKILRGAKRTLEECEFVIAELSVRRRFKDQYQFSEVVALLAEAGFEFFCTLSDKPGIPMFYDCLFLKRTSNLITNQKR